jgi:hypothetical protein
MVATAATDGMPGIAPSPCFIRFPAAAQPLKSLPFAVPWQSPGSAIPPTNESRNMTARDFSLPGRRASGVVLALVLAAALGACGGGTPAASAAGGAASESFRPTIAATPRIAAMTASANMVANPGFESGMTGWMDWGNTLLLDVGAGGSAHAVRVGTAAGGVGHDVAGIIGGTQYHFSAQAMVSDASEVAYVGVNIVDGANNVVARQAVPVSTTTPSLATLDITAPANAVKATVFLWKNAGSGYGYADDFTLAPADATSVASVASTANLVAEPGFENGLSAWSNWGNASAAAGQGSSGAAALRVGTGAGGVGQEVTGVAPGTTYHLTGQVRVSDLSEVAFLGVAFLDPGGAKLQERNVAVSATTYAAAGVDLLAPAGTAKAMVYVWKNAGAGYAYVDDVALTPTAGATAPAGTTAPTTSGVTASSGQSGAGVPTLGGCQLFPANAIFNTRIDDTARFPRSAMSDAWTALAGASLPLQTDWGVNDNPANWSTYWGMPINVIDSWDTQWPLVSFDFSASGQYWGQGYPFKSDCAVPNGAGGYGVQRDCTQVPASTTHFPFPVDGKLLNEGGQCNDPNGCGDHHVLVVEKGACRLWESYFSYQLNGQWYSMATAAWDLNSLALRPDNWASGDAAGLPMTPLLVKTAEANSGEIRHALRVDFRDAALALQHVWPARFAAGADNPGAIPFGALLRLRADFVIPDTWTVQAKAIATAAKRYGMYVADNGGDFHIQGEPNAGWDPATSQQLKSITLQNMEFVDLHAITGDARFDPNSMAASW